MKHEKLMQHEIEAVVIKMCMIYQYFFSIYYKKLAFSSWNYSNKKPQHHGDIPFTYYHG